MNNIAIYPGSFDPMTLGHQFIVEQALKIFDHLFICLAVNPDKKGLFSPEENARIINEIYADYGNVDVVIHSGLMVEKALDVKADAIVRGLRSTIDFEYEHNALVINSQLANIPTFFVMSPINLASVSSSYVKQLMKFRRSRELVKGMVCPIVYDKLAEKIQSVD